MLLHDTSIRELASAGMIVPFEEGEKRKGIISFGLSACGYDIRVAEEIRLATAPYPTHTVLDPKDPDIKHLFSSPLRIFPSEQGSYVMLPPHSFALAHSVERIKMPEDVFAIAVGKSTLARIGLVVNITPIEPGWEGFITLEISNTTPLSAKLYVGEGISQLIFYRTAAVPEKTYAGKSGKYQNQAAQIVHARVD